MALTDTDKPRKGSLATARLDEFIHECGDKCKLTNWTEFTEVVTLPGNLAAALHTGRPELIKLAVPTTLTQEQCAGLYHALGVLIETNMVLREHAQLLAQQVNNWADAFKQLESVGRKVQRFANFEPITQEDESDD